MSDGVKDYLTEVSRKKVLTEDEKIILGVQITALRDLGLVPAAKLPANYKEFSPEQQQIIKTGTKAFNRYFEGNLRFVVFVAKKYNKKSTDLLSLIQWGNMGLIKAIEKFDFNKVANGRKVKFSTYAYWWIKQCITRGLTNTARTIRLPIHISDALDKVNRVIQALIVETGSEPSIEAIAARSKLSEKEVKFILESNRAVCSLNVPLNSEDGTELEDIISSEPESNLDDLRDSLEDCFERLLTPLERDIIERYHGLKGAEESLKNISSTLKIPKNEVENLYQTALQKLRTQSEVLKYFF